MNNAVFEKTKENVRNNRDISLATTKARGSLLVLEPNYHAQKCFLKIY